MKTKFILSFAALAMTLSSFSQIKVFSGGSVSIGSTTSPTLNGVMHHISGGQVAFLANTSSSATSAPLIVGQNAVSSSPGFAFLGDYQTGIAHPASSILAITIGNSEKFRFNSSNQILAVNTTSSALTPDFSWNSDANTGVYHPSDDILGFVSNGTEVMRINTLRQILNSNTSHNANSPDFSFNANNTTGMFLVSTANLGFSTGATEKLRINSSGQLLSYNAPGTAASPDFSWGNDNNTGIFNPANDIMAFATNGIKRAWIDYNGTLVVATPTDNAAGIYSVTLNSDWVVPTSLTYVNRANSANYQVQLSGTTKFYVAGQGWIFSDGNYLGSDINIKDDIKSIDSAMTRLNKINGVTYKLKVEKQNPSVYGTATEYMGVIAQDVEKAAPQVVKTLPDGTKAVCYEMLVGLLVEALKEQNTKITQLQNDVNNCCAKTGSTQQNRFNANVSETKSEGYAGDSYIKQNVPNPFNKETSIEYFIAEKSAASSILIFDMNGKLLKTYKLNGNGQGSLNIVGNELTPGMYYYSLIVNTKEVGTKKMILTE